MTFFLNTQFWGGPGLSVSPVIGQTLPDADTWLDLKQVSQTDLSSVNSKNQVV